MKDEEKNIGDILWGKPAMPDYNHRIIFPLPTRWESFQYRLKAPFLWVKGKFKWLRGKDELR